MAAILLPETMIKLAKLNGEPEIFFSIQGEGRNLGSPSVFIRLSLCNLYCVWCDTDYTWNWKGTDFAHVKDSDALYTKYTKEEVIIQMTDEQIIETIESYQCANLVFTGGEPLVQQKDLLHLLKTLREKNAGYRMEIETNGTIIPSEEMDALLDQYNVSVKLTNSKIRERERIRPEAIGFFSATPKSNFKFVVDSEIDVDEVLQIVNEFNINPRKVYLMPQGMTVQSLREKQQWVIEKCKKYSFNYTDRLHIQIYGDKRGV